MKKRSIFDIIKSASEDYNMLKELADKLREKKPVSAGFLDEATYYLESVHDTLHHYLDSLTKEDLQQK